MLSWVVIVAVVAVAAVVVFFFVRRRRDSGKIVSIVAFRSQRRDLTEVDVRGSVRRALGVESEVTKFSHPDGLTNMFSVVAESLPPFAVIDSTRRYMEPEEVPSVANSLEDPIARAAIENHRAWVSVDAIGVPPSPSKERRFNIYDRILGPVAAELCDDKTLIFYLPYETRLGMADAAGVELLSKGQTLQAFSSFELNMPIIGVERGDAKAQRAIEIAKKRLPELLDALRKDVAGSDAIVKVGYKHDDDDEFCWLHVTAIREKTLVARMESRPIAPNAPKQGEEVEVAFDQIVDWAYMGKDGKPVGMFLERVLAGNR